MFPSLADIVVNLDPDKRVHDRTRFSLRPLWVDDESITEVENGLLTKTEFANRGSVRRLAASAEGRYASLVFDAKFPVIDYKQAGPTKQRIWGFRPAWLEITANGLRAGVVGILQQFLEHREARTITIGQIALDLIQYRYWGNVEARHSR